jgi:hypothetical protein
LRPAFWIAAFALAAVALAPAAAAPFRPTPAAQPPAPPEGQSVTDSRLPLSGRFADLDAYLAYLRQRSHVDGAWYREIRPGIFELQTGNLRLPGGDKPRPTFTREQLEKKFGFAK